MIRLHTRPPPPTLSRHKLDQQHTGRLIKRGNLLTRAGGGGQCGAVSYDRKKAWFGPRETREGWPLLLTVETEANAWGQYKWKGSFLGWFVGLLILVQEICVLAWLPKSLSPSKLVRQSCRVACLLMCVSAWSSISYSIFSEALYRVQRLWCFFEKIT
jgi:hypothetical protein